MWSTVETEKKEGHRWCLYRLIAAGARSAGADNQAIDLQLLLPLFAMFSDD